MFKNPLKIEDKVNNGFGDPFVMRWNGTYYLYPSTNGEEGKIYCYSSKDMVNFTFEGAVANDEVLAHAYAPEVIYYEGYFYLVTSPSGNGHYLFKANSPLGPFERISENIHNMIDGSFFIDSENKLYLLRANHNGISMCQVDVNKGTVKNRIDLNAPLNAWTEGPGLFYFNKYYYLTYTGNNVCSTGYRVNYSTSKEFNTDFLPGEMNPLLISTEGTYKRFGHSSNALGLNLDSYYTYFHELDISRSGKHHLRQVMLARLDFNGRMMSANVTSSMQNLPQKPLETSHGIESLSKVRDYLYFYNGKNYQKEYTIECVIKKDTKILISYDGIDNFIYLTFDNHSLKVIERSFGRNEILLEKHINFDFSNFHTVRVIHGENKFEILIDNAPILTFEKVSLVHKVGYYVSNKENILFNGINKFANNSSSKEVISIIPGLLFPKCKKLQFYNKYGTFAGFLDNNEEIKYRLHTKKNYFISIHAKLEKAKIMVNDKVIELEKSNDEFEFNEYDLGKFFLTNELKIKVIEGEIEFNYINVKEIKEHFAISNIHSRKDEDKYTLSENDALVNEISFDLAINKNRLYQKAGCLFQASNFSEDINQARYPITSFLVGIENSLLIVDFLNYGDKRIYDVPVNLKKLNKINVFLHKNEIEVVLNNETKIITNVPYLNRYGRVGIYISKESALKITNLEYKEDKLS